VNWSFIIPSFNSFPCIAETIESILQLRGGQRIADIVVVDSSDDQTTRDYLRSLRDERLRLVLLDERRVMPGRQRNIGARHAAGEVLAFIDADVRLDPCWLDEAAKAIAGGCAIGGGSIDVPASQRGSGLALSQLFLQFNEFLPVGSLRPVGCLPSANLFCTRALFDRVGGFPSLRASEDVVFCKRAEEFAQVMFVPDARASHLFRTSFKSFIRNQAMLGEYIITYRKLLYRRWYYTGPVPLLLAPAVMFLKSGRIAKRVTGAGTPYIGGFLRSLPLFMLGMCAWGWGWMKGCVNGRARQLRDGMDVPKSPSPILENAACN